MNLSKLFEMQKTLDEHIIEKKGLQGQDLLRNTILGLDSELGELVNEWQGFKHWKEDNEPRTFVEITCPSCDDYGSIENKNYPDSGNAEVQCPTCKGDGQIRKNPLLEEFVDCLHFILSIGLQLKIQDDWEIDLIESKKEIDIIEQFLAFNEFLKVNLDAHDWFDITSLFKGLGEMLGFTWEQIEQAYIKKNEVNHERQANGY